MKHFMLGAALVFAFAGISQAGVNRIVNNGQYSGVPSWRVDCSGGSSYVIYQKNGTWYRGDIGHMGDRYNSWSRDQLAQYLCN